MDILFLNCSYSALQVAEFQKNSKRGFQSAAQNYQEALTKGFVNNPIVSLKALSIPSLSTFPFGNRSLFIKNVPYVFDGNELGKSFGFLNLPILNKAHQSRIDRYIDNWHAESKAEEKVILVYAMQRNLMQYAVDAKKRHKGIKLCLFVPDLPIYMNCNKYYKLLGLQKRDVKIINRLYRLFDKYVLLTQPMAQYLQLSNRPYLIVDGLYNETPFSVNQKADCNTKTLMYAGGIQTRYGVFDLIEAFSQIDNKNFKLVLCGPCSEMDTLTQYLHRDNRIQYLGVIPTTSVREMQKSVTLLVNPRHSNEEFTKYSFPSKTIEYMASGTPVLMCPLPSMSEEYYNYVYLLDDESINGMRDKIISICSLDSKELSKKGYNARNFILENKTAAKQVSRIINFLHTNEC